MDPRPPFTAGKILRSKPDEALKSKVREPLTSNRRVFGTVRNQNALVSKTAPGKAKKKPVIPQKPKKQLTHLTAVHQQSDGTPKNVEESVEQNKENLLPEANVSVSGEEGAKTPLKSAFLVKKARKKSVNFRDEVEDMADSGKTRTPLKSPSSVKPFIPGTPYRTAERCSKCRFDKLETSSYWISQIRLAESSGKHFVSADFFRLASECKAEPVRNMKVEVKKYLGRHEHLSGEKEWKDLCISYGITKEESDAVTSADDTVEIDGAGDEEEKQIMEQMFV